MREEVCYINTVRLYNLSLCVQHLNLVADIVQVAHGCVKAVAADDLDLLAEEHISLSLEKSDFTKGIFYVSPEDGPKGRARF